MSDLGYGPNASERRLIARCLFEGGVLIGSPDEIWSHSDAYRALGTWRECIDAITQLTDGKHMVRASFVKACVMQSEDLNGQVPFELETIADFVTSDSEARHYWDQLMADDRFPGRCPFCGAAAYIGFFQIECKSRCAKSIPRG